jgi:hypothetical protein
LTRCGRRLSAQRLCVRSRVGDLGRVCSMRVKEEAMGGMEKTGTSSAHRRGLSSAHGMRVTKRAIAGRRAAPSTPVPSWRVFNNHLYDGMTRPPPASARKLAATLWELQDLPLPASLSACLPSPNWLMSSPPDSRSPLSQPVSPPASLRHVKVPHRSIYSLIHFLPYARCSKS